MVSAEQTRALVLDTTDSGIYFPLMHEGIEKAGWTKLDYTEPSYALEDLLDDPTGFHAIVVALGRTKKAHFNGGGFIAETKPLSLARAIISSEPGRRSLARSSMPDIYIPGIYERTDIPQRLASWLTSLMIPAQ